MVVYKFKTPIILKVEHGVLVMTVGSQSVGSQFETNGQSIFDSLSWNFCSESVGYKILRS